MAISARIRDERWNDLEVSDVVSFSRLSNRARRLNKPLLSGLNPYGATVFNSLQVPALLDEAEEIFREEPDNIHEAVQELQRLVAVVIESRSHLLVFLGD